MPAQPDPILVHCIDNVGLGIDSVGLGVDGDEAGI